MLAVWAELAWTEGRLNSEWIFEVIVFLEIPTQNYKDFCPTKHSTFFWDLLVIVGSFFGYDPCFGWHFGKNNDLINSFWIQPTFKLAVKESEGE